MSVFKAKRGYPGDTRAPERVFVAIVSRLLERPMNLAIVAGSARALIYDDDDFTNRYVVVGEADSIPDEGPVAAAIRAIAETGAMTYDVAPMPGVCGVTRRSGAGTVAAMPEARLFRGPPPLQG